MGATGDFPPPSDVRCLQIEVFGLARAAMQMLWQQEAERQRLWQYLLLKRCWSLSAPNPLRVT